VVDHRRPSHDPGVGLPGVGIATLLGAKDGCLLLCFAYEDDPFAAVELGVVLLGDVVLALPLGERDQGNLFLLDEAINGVDEGGAHRGHQRRRSEGLTAMEPEEGGDTAIGLQPGLIDVEIHAVDAFDFERHVVLEDIGGGTW
jgi:hypothetical protein